MRSGRSLASLPSIPAIYIQAQSHTSRKCNQQHRYIDHGRDVAWVRFNPALAPAFGSRHRAGPRSAKPASNGITRGWIEERREQGRKGAGEKGRGGEREKGRKGEALTPGPLPGHHVPMVAGEGRKKPYPQNGKSGIRISKSETGGKSPSHGPPRPSSADRHLWSAGIYGSSGFRCKSCERRL